jgi:prevent-host-death family protein
MGRGSWQLQDAKARFSELFRLVGSQGPQRVTRQGKESVVVLRAEQYDELINRKKGPKSIVDFFAQSPLVNAGLTLRRSFDGGRNIRL